MATVQKGKCSWFGGFDDTGVSLTEGLALVEPSDLDGTLFEGYFLPGNRGLARRLNKSANYIAMRWDYSVHSRSDLREKLMVKVTNPKSGVWVLCRPIDWGPNVRTGRICDLSAGALTALGLVTDDEVTCEVIERFSRPV